LSGQWILSDLSLAQWHPGYLLPTVGGGFVASAVASGFGEHSLAQGLFGYGLLCWMVLGSIVFARLFTQPALPPALQGTLAIELAPPVVAGLAWVAINGGEVVPVALFLAGYAFLMALVQVRLIPFYRRIPFNPGWWAFSFPYAAATAYGIRWLAIEHVTGLHQWIWLLLAVITAGILALVSASAVALRRHRFLPPAPPAPPVVPANARTEVDQAAVSPGAR
jgi:tellurite resistance protein